MRAERARGEKAARRGPPAREPLARAWSASASWGLVEAERDQRRGEREGASSTPPRGSSGARRLYSDAVEAIWGVRGADQAAYPSSAAHGVIAEAPASGGSGGVVEVAAPPRGHRASDVGYPSLERREARARAISPRVARDDVATEPARVAGFRGALVRARVAGSPLSRARGHGAPARGQEHARYERYGASHGLTSWASA